MKNPHAELTGSNLVGLPLRRYEGRAKVTGAARYAADNALPGLVHACGVFSTHANARIADIDHSAASRSPGVLGIWDHRNMPRLYRSSNDMEAGTRVGEIRLPFEDAHTHYAGQFVAVVAADTFEHAREAAALVKVRYEETAPPAVTIDRALDMRGASTPSAGEDISRGDFSEGWNDAAFRIEATYETPVEVHCALELHAAVATWHGDALEVWDSTQWVVGQAAALAEIFGIPPEQVTVHSPFIGGGFGGKLFLWPHSVVAALVAQQLKRPVKLMVDRRATFTTTGHRPATRQKLRLAAAADGKLRALSHETISHTSTVHEFVESCGSTSAALYECPHVCITQRLARADVGTPTPMRAPGAASGTFALESAIDELAIAASMDPIDFRLRNIAARDASSEGAPWSSNHLAECYRQARERFCWNARNPIPKSQRDGDEWVGFGMATASWPTEGGEATVKATLRADGTAQIACATQDIGTGTYTVIAQVAAEVLDLRIESVEVAIGHSFLPPGPISGGSMVTATVVPVVARAARNLRNSLLSKACEPGGIFEGEDPATLRFKHGHIEGPRRVALKDIFDAAGIHSLEAEARSGEPGKFSFRSFGAHCVEVRWNPKAAQLRVSRAVSVFDVGRVINHATATNQIHGSLLMGLGMALLEESVYDRRTGRVVTDNLADYLVPVHADTPRMDIHFLDRPDPHIGEFGAKGIGEVGITGFPAAIANAVFHATGKRIRKIPIKVEDLLECD